jgi:hypothetical protein
MFVTGVISQRATELQEMDTGITAVGSEFCDQFRTVLSVWFHTQIQKEPRTWADSLDKRPKRQNADMRFGT